MKMSKPTSTFLISVRPTWASAFFLDRDPKTIELRKGNERSIPKTW